METLIARFIKYIEEEAPKNGEVTGQNKMKSLVSETVKNDLNSEQYKLLQEKYEVLELKYSTTKKYFENILSHTENKSTGLNKKPVIELPMGDINEYKAYLKRL